MRTLVFRTCSLLVALMLVLSSSHSASAQEVSPRWNLQKGQVFDVVMKQDVVGDITLAVTPRKP